MLDTIRKYANSWVAQLLMGLLVLSFGAWGVNDVFNGFHTNDVAQVGSQAITVNDFQREYQAATTTLSQRMGAAITPEQAQQFGLPNQVLGSLVSQATLDNAAGKMGLGVSNDALSQKITTDPQFVGGDGKFDRNLMNQVIQQYGYTPDDFILSQRREVIRGQLGQAFAGGIVTPTAYLQAVHEYQAEARDISYLLLTAPAATDIPDPTDTDLANYFAQHKDQWKAPELRSFTYTSLSPADLAATEDVTDDEVQKAYNDRKAQYTTPETRHVEQIVFKDKATADAAAAAIGGGKSFEDVMAEQNLKPADVDLGVITRDKILDTKVADAAFSQAPDTVSPVIDGQFGPVIVRVTQVTPATTKTLDDVRDDLKKELATEKASADVQTAHDAIEDMRAGGSTLADAAAKYGLKIVTVQAADASGNDSNGNPIANLPQGLVGAVFQSDVGLENDPIQPDSSSYVWYDVTNVTQPRDRTIGEVHDKVVAAWKDDQRTRKLEDQATTAKQHLDAKEDIAQVATDLGTTVKKSTGLTRVMQPAGDISADVITAAFSGPQGTAAIANGADAMTRIVLVVDNVTLPPFDAKAPELTTSKQTLDSQFINAFLSLYVGQLQNQTKVSYNQVALNQVIGGSTDTQQ
jgi:peptidyl-prolyl cis-trans isomerase D